MDGRPGMVDRLRMARGRAGERGLFGLSYGELDAVVRVMHGIDPGEAALVARFKYMQRMGFPEGVNPGRGVRAVYDLEATLKVLLAFELLETGATPTRVVRMVRTGWAALRPALALGWLAAIERGARPRRLMVIAMPAAFREFGQPDDPAAAVAEPLRTVPVGALGEWIAGMDVSLPEAAADVVPGDGPRRFMIDPMRVAAIMRAVIPEVSPMDADDVDLAFAELGAAAFSGAPRSAWPDTAMRTAAARKP